MGQLATDIHTAALAQIPAAPVTDPADLMTGPQLLQVFASVEAAIAVLELRTRGARVVRVAGVPDNAADGEDGDLGLNTLTADYYGKDSGTWTFLYNGKGPRGNDATGAVGASAYQLAQQQGFVGSIDQWLASLGRKGDDGRSAYQVAVANGFSGTVALWLASLKGETGEPGAAGGLDYHESFAPTASYGGKRGDTFYFHQSGTQYQIWDYPSDLVAAGANPWRLRFTTPDPVVVTTPTTSTPPGTGTGGHTIQDEGVMLTARAVLNFIGPNVVARDNVGAGTTEIVILNKEFTETLHAQDVTGFSQNIFDACLLKRLRKDANMSSLEWSTDGTTYTAVAFSAGLYQPNTPLTLAGGSRLYYRWTYASGKFTTDLEQLFELS